MDAAFHLGAHSGAQHREGTNLVMVVLPAGGRSREIWWALLQLSQETSKRTQPQSASVVVRWLAFLTKKQRHGAMPPHSLPELASLQPCCQVTENIIWEPEMWYNGITFLPWAKGVLCDQSQCWGTGGMLQRSKVTITRRAKQQRSWPSSSAH